MSDVDEKPVRERRWVADIIRSWLPKLDRRGLYHVAYEALKLAHHDGSEVIAYHGDLWLAHKSTTQYDHKGDSTLELSLRRIHRPDKEKTT